MAVFVLYNPMSQSGKGMELAKKIETVTGMKDVTYVDLLTLNDLDAYLAGVSTEDTVVLSGGDGTLNYYANHTTEETRKRKMGFWAAGTGNDFMRDVPEVKDGYLENVNPYLHDLPIVTVNGEERKFINGIGFGIDGYCCEVGDELRDKSDKPVNYTAVAVKGCLFHFKPVTAEVTIDGKTSTIPYSWMASAMNGRYYGGGMMAAPEQDRKSSSEGLTAMVFHSKSKIKTLLVFSKIFTGEHVKSNIVDIQKAKVISVKFDRPCALQVDGDTVRNVTEYTARVAEGE